MPSGGNHGGGRPPSLVRATKANTRIAQTLRDEVNVTLEETALQYRELVRKGIQMALDGNVALLKEFIELPFKSLDFTEVPDNNLDVVREMLSHVNSPKEQPGTNTQKLD